MISSNDFGSNSQRLLFLSPPTSTVNSSKPSGASSLKILELNNIPKKFFLSFFLVNTPNPSILFLIFFFFKPK